MLKVSAFYLEKQKSFIPKKIFFGRTAKIHPKDGVSRLNFPEGFGLVQNSFGSIEGRGIILVLAQLRAGPIDGQSIKILLGFFSVFVWFLFLPRTPNQTRCVWDCFSWSELFV